MFIIRHAWSSWGTRCKRVQFDPEIRFSLKISKPYISNYFASLFHFLKALQHIMADKKYC